MYSSTYMAQFVVVARDDSKIGPVLAEIYPNDHMQVWAGVWLVSDDAVTAQQVADKLKISDGVSGSAIVVSMNGYWGFAPKNVWEWLTVKGAPKHGSST